MLLKKLRQSQIQRDTVQKVSKSYDPQLNGVAQTRTHHFEHCSIKCFSYFYFFFQPSALSSSSAPPPLIRGTITSIKGSQQVNLLIMTNIILHIHIGSTLVNHHLHTVSDSGFFLTDFDRQKFRHSHSSATGERRAAGVVQTWLPDHHAASGQGGTGKSV